MKKNIDVSQKVMKRIVKFEKRRSIFLLILILVVSAFLVLVTVWKGVTAIQKVLERQSLTLLTLFTEDREIIAEFWKDTLEVFWQELPKEEIVIALLGFFVFVLFEFKVGKKIKIIIRKLKNLAKYSKNLK